LIRFLAYHPGIAIEDLHRNVFPILLLLLLRLAVVDRVEAAVSKVLHLHFAAVKFDSVQSLQVSITLNMWWKKIVFPRR
jgi:hypothetical protein